MSKKMIETLKNFDTERLNSFLDEKVKPVYIESYDIGFQGWYHLICLDEENNLSIYGAMSPGTIPMSVYEGSEVVLSKLTCRGELNFELTMEHLGLLSEDDKTILIDEVKEDLFTEEELNEKIITLEMCFEENSSEVENALIENLDTAYREFINDEIISQWDNYYCEQIKEDIDDTIETILDAIED